MPLKKITNKTLREIVYDKIKNSIVTADMLPGELISLRSLATELGVSQMPVREALLQLEREKAVEIVSNKSIRVSKLSPDELDEILMIRLSLEIMAAEKACEVRRDSALPKLKTLLSDMRACLEKPKEYFNKNVQFHFGIYKLANLPNLYNIIDGLWVRIGPYLNIHFLDLGYIQKEAMLYHERMYDAIKEHDAVEIRNALTKDLEKTADRIRPMLGKPLHKVISKK